MLCSNHIDESVFFKCYVYIYRYSYITHRYLDYRMIRNICLKFGWILIVQLFDVSSYPILLERFSVGNGTYI